jgi:hypothetical protein
MANYLAHASQSAYLEHGDAIRELGPDHRITFFSSGQFRGLICFHDRFTILAFRGTENVENFLTDADTFFVSQFPYPGRVHSGFAKAITEIWVEVRRILGSPARAKPLWVTGHSLGGAMATLASVRLASEGYTVRAVYTFGSPRVGDRTFRKKYRLPNYRFVNDNDLVPHLPFSWCYKHVGELRLMQDGHGLSEVRAAWVRKKRQLASKAKQIHREHRHTIEVLYDLFDFDWLTDHYLDRYVSAIQKLLSNSDEPRDTLLESDSAGIAIKSFWPDSAALDILHPSAEKYPRRKSKISDADFIVAFGRPPQQNRENEAAKFQKQRRSA